MTDEMEWMYDNPFGLSPQELRVLRYWRKNGGNMTEAYKEVMLSEYDKQAIKKQALNKRVHRFFSTYRIRQAMASCPGYLGVRARDDFKKRCERGIVSAKRAYRRIESKVATHSESELTEEEQAFVAVQAAHSDDANYPASIINDTDDESAEGDSDCENGIPDDERGDDVMSDGEPEQDECVHEEPVAPPEPRLPKKKKYKPDHVGPDYQSLLGTLAEHDPNPPLIENDRELWMKSLNISKEPSALTVYGTGQFIIYMAVKEMMDRKDAIRRGNISVLDKNGSVFTPTLINAIKTAAAMIIPFAPAPNAADRKEMSKAAVLLGLLPDRIEEDPDAYTAPPPAAIDVE